MMSKNRLSGSIILGIDTSLNNCSVSLSCGAILLAEKANSQIREKSENLFSLVDQVFNEANLELKSLTAIGVCVGPGNFTGLRIGISAAKGLAMALKIKVFGVSRFIALVESNEPTIAIIKSTNDIFYTQEFINQKPSKSPASQTLTELMSARYSPNTIISGDSAITLSQSLNLRLGMSKSIPSAKHITSKILGYLENGGPSPAPLYVRGPDAKLPKEPVPIILNPDGP